ncbi:MAG TPA: DUF5689 domain-containing protein [Bacteroidia bacterium]
MIKIKHIAFLIFLTAAFVLFFSCKKTPDRPHINTAAAGGALTISQLKAMFNANNGQNIKFTQDISLFVTVIMTDNYKTLYIKDQTGAICLKQKTAHGIFAGDSLRVNLNGSTLDQSAANSSLQIDSVDVSSSPTNKVVKLDVGKPTLPITVTIAQLKNSASDTSFNSITGQFFVPRSIYDGQLVQINDVQFSFASRGLFIPYGSPTYVLPAPVLYDCGALTNIQMSLYSGTADFQNQQIPYNKSGSIIGAISFYNNALQITPRSFADLKFNQPRCGLQALNQTFDTVACGAGATITALFPGWTNAHPVGSQFWAGTTSGTIYYPSVSVTYSSDARNVAWLITPPIQNSPTKNINFQTTTISNAIGLNQLSVLVSTDFNGYNLGGVGSPVTIGTQAIWTDITSSFNITTSNYNFYNASPAYPVGVTLSATNASSILSGYTGTFYVGFRYTGVKLNPDSAASYGINNVVIKN